MLKAPILKSTQALKTPALVIPGLNTPAESIPGLNTPAVSIPALRSPALTSLGLKIPALRRSLESLSLVVLVLGIPTVHPYPC